MLFLSKRKRAPPTAEEIARHKQKKRNIQIVQISLIALRHEVIGIWQYGMNTYEFHFPPKNVNQIIQCMWSTKPGYQKKAAAKSFLYHALKQHKEGCETPHLEPHRDRRGENRRKTTR